MIVVFDYPHFPKFVFQRVNKVGFCVQCSGPAQDVWAPVRVDVLFNFLGLEGGWLTLLRVRFQTGDNF